MKTEQKRAMMETTNNICLYFMLFIFILAIIALGARKIDQQKAPVTMEQLDIETKKFDGTYEISSSEAYRKDNVTYVNVEIGNYKLIVPESVYTKHIADNTSVDSEIFVYTATTTTKTMLSDLAGNKVTVVRASCLGQSDFTEDEMNEMNLKSCEILTNQRRSTLQLEEKKQPPAEYSVD